MTNNNPQNNTQKIKVRATRTPLKTGVNSGAPEWLTGSSPHVIHIVLLLNDKNKR